MLGEAYWIMHQWALENAYQSNFQPYLFVHLEIKNSLDPFGRANKVRLAKGKYYKRGSHNLSNEAKAEIYYLYSIEWDKQLFEEQARSKINETLTIFCPLNTRF